MTTTSQLKTAVTQYLRDHGGFPAKMEILDRKPKSIKSDMDAALSKTGLAAWVMPIVPKRVMVGTDTIVFYEVAEITIRLVEHTVLNRSEVDLFDLIPLVELCLQGQAPGGLQYDTPPGILAQPLQLAPTPVGFTEGADEKGELVRVVEIFFNASYREWPCQG